MSGILGDNPNAEPPEARRDGRLPWLAFLLPKVTSYLGALPKVRRDRVRGGILGLRELKRRKPLKGHPRPRTWAEKANQRVPVHIWRQMAGKDSKYLPLDRQTHDWLAYRIEREANTERETAAEQAYDAIRFDANPWPTYSLTTWWRWWHRGFWRGPWPKMGRPPKTDKLSNADKQRAYRERKKARLGKG